MAIENARLLPLRDAQANCTLLPLPSFLAAFALNTANITFLDHDRKSKKGRGSAPFFCFGKFLPFQLPVRELSKFGLNCMSHAIDWNWGGGGR
jgi:hypothetical protein